MPRAATERKKAANGYKLAKPLPPGEILEDLAKKKWKLGPSIGQGGFGEIYSAQEPGTGSKYPYVVKIEPHENGPLFVEMHFYIKVAKREDVEAFKSQKGLKTFGMPVYLGSGSHEFNGEKYRFIVMEKLGTDLWKVFLEHDRHFPSSTVFKIAVQILDILEYIHSKGYIHADIKGANILMGTTKETLNKQVYLVDFGLATKCNEDAEFKPNPKKANDGTIEYLSRDAHKGVQSKRGDLETLAYNLIQWLGCTLPWEKNLKDPASVQKSKEEYMSSVFKFIKACFDKRSPPGPIVDFLNCLSTLSHNSTPDYKNIRKIFLSGIESGDALGKPLQFTLPEKSPVKRKNATVPKSAPKKKQAKKQAEEEESEGEKENFEEDEPIESDKEAEVVAKKETKEPRGKKTSGFTHRKKTAKATNAKDIADIEESNHVNEIGDDESEKEENGESIETENSKRKKKAPQKRKTTKTAKKAPEEDAEEPEESNGTEKDDEPLPEHSTRTRQRGRQINYKEDSDEEGKRKRTKNPVPVKERHVTGDNLDGYTDAMKQVKRNLQNNKSKKKTKKNEEETNETDEKETKPAKVKKSRAVKNVQDV